MAPEQIEMLKRAIDTHIGQLYRNAGDYKKNRCREAKMDCFVEIRKYEKLKKEITMNVRIKYKSAAEAERAAEKLPVACKWRIVKDRTTDAYLEVPEDYEDYVMRYLPPEK